MVQPAGQRLPEEPQQQHRPQEGDHEGQEQGREHARVQLAGGGAAEGLPDQRQAVGGTGIAQGEVLMRHTAE